MPEAEAMRFLHGVVDMVALAAKLKQKFPKDANGLMICVRMLVCLRAYVRAHMLI